MRIYDRLSVEKEDYPECRSTVFRPSWHDDDKIDFREPDDELELEFVYGYSGWTPTIGGTNHGDQNIFYLRSLELIYPASAVVVMYNTDQHSQRFFFGHDDDVSSIAVHPNGVVVASGQVGHAPPIILWDSGAGRSSSTDSTEQQLQKLNFHRRCISSMDFSRDGRLLVSVGGGDNHPVAVWDWEQVAISWRPQRVMVPLSLHAPLTLSTVEPLTRASLRVTRIIPSLAAVKAHQVLDAQDDTERGKTSMSEGWAIPSLQSLPGKKAFSAEDENSSSHSSSATLMKPQDRNGPR